MGFRLVIAALAVLLAWPVAAAPNAVLNGSFAICDPNNPANCLAPNASGGLPGGGGGGGSITLPNSITMTVTNPAVAASSPTQIAPQSGRTYLQFENETGGDCHFVYGTTATPTATAGMLLANRASQTLEASAITSQAVSVWCASAGMFDVTQGQ